VGNFESALELNIQYTDKCSKLWDLQILVWNWNIQTFLYIHLDCCKMTWKIIITGDFYIAIVAFGKQMMFYEINTAAEHSEVMTRVFICARDSSGKVKI
jgi:hypothetical protein